MMWATKKKMAQAVTDRLKGKVKPEDPNPRKWYNKDPFPLIPWIWTKPANEYNTFGWQFEWLLFKAWSMDSCDFELAVVFDLTHWGVGITGKIPYVRFTLCLPTHQKIQSWIQTNLWRKSKHDREVYQTTADP